MDDTQHADGNVAAGLRGLATSLVTNRRAFNTTLIGCALGSAASWAFIPNAWQAYVESPEATRGWPLLPLSLTIVGIVAIGLPTWFQLHKDWVSSKVAEEQAEEQEKEEAELVGLLQGYLAPLIEELPMVAVPGQAGREALTSIRKGVMGTTQAICGPPGGGVRAVWFEATAQTLSPKDWTGGSCNSSRKFTKRQPDEAGVEAWRVASTGLPRLYDDLSRAAPPGYRRGPNSSYATFITCGVLGSSGEVRGMLTIDAPTANLLTEVDAVVVGVCCKVLSAACSLSERRASL